MINRIIAISKAILYYPYNWVLKLLYFVCLIFPVDHKRVFINHFDGKGFSDNPKYIVLELKKRHRNMNIYCLNSEKDFHNNGEVNFVKPRSLKSIFFQATSGIWISSVRMPYYSIKRAEQVYIQTWHAGIALKKVEADAVKKLSKRYIKKAIHDSKIIDLMVSNSKWESDLYRKAFWYKGEILECGLPREDIFAFPSIDIENKVLDFYKLNKKDIHLVLYAPTFRVDGNIECYDIDFNRLLNALINKWGGTWKILVRLHPNIQKKQDKIKYDDNILNGSQYGDINDLIIASDVVISDYSSCMFDGMLAQKKVVLYASDIEEYDKDRGTLFEFKELPFPLAITNDELIDIIRTFDENIYAEKCKNFKDKVGLFELGNGSRKVVDWIESKLGL